MSKAPSLTTSSSIVTFDSPEELWPPQVPLEYGRYDGEDEYGIWSDTWIGKIQVIFRWIPPGEFLMGFPSGEKGQWDDEVQHRVRLTKGFWLMETTVTQKLYEKVMENNPSYFKGEDLPVEMVSWHDTQEFIAKLNKYNPIDAFSLPTDAQWEYACRAGTTTKYSFGNKITQKLANYYRNSGTKPVKSYPPNQWGLYQMHGNVEEWCADGRRSYGFRSYDNKVQFDPVGPMEDGVWRVVRGGNGSSLALECRSAYRDSHGHPNAYVGFRCTRVQRG